jgi:hypothetical protein
MHPHTCTPLQIYTLNLRKRVLHAHNRTHVYVHVIYTRIVARTCISHATTPTILCSHTYTCFGKVFVHTTCIRAHELTFLPHSLILSLKTKSLPDPESYNEMFACFWVLKRNFVPSWSQTATGNPDSVFFTHKSSSSHSLSHIHTSFTIKDIDRRYIYIHTCICVCLPVCTCICA